MMIHMIEMNCNSFFIDREKEIEHNEIILIIFISLSSNNLNITMNINIENKSHCYDKIKLLLLCDKKIKLLYNFNSFIL